MGHFARRGQKSDLPARIRRQEEMAGLGFKETGVVVDFEVGDTVVVTTGAWKDTVGVIESINEERQTLTIRVELFGRETPVELNFTEIKKMM